MKLTYRGIDYDYVPTVVGTRDTGLTGKYRGADVHFKAADPVPYGYSANLKYRGVAYTVGEPEAVGVAPEASPKAVPAIPVSVDEWMRRLVVRHLHNVRRREQSMLTRAEKDVGLTTDDTATDYESHIQGKVPHDFGGYDRSSSAMS
ncbi:MAG: DUF4278 domain-containing protein [Cyanobacteria bacterium P01_D01_bin.14]